MKILKTFLIIFICGIFFTFCKCASIKIGSDERSSSEMKATTELIIRSTSVNVMKTKGTLPVNETRIYEANLMNDTKLHEKNSMNETKTRGTRPPMNISDASTSSVRCNVNVEKSSERNSSPSSSPTPTPIPIGNRNAISAPETCPENQKLDIEGRCRTVVT